MQKSIFLLLLLATTSFGSRAQYSKTFSVSSPDKTMIVKVEVGESITWSVLKNSQTIISPSALSVSLESGEVLGRNSKIKNHKINSIDNTISGLNYKKLQVHDHCNELSLQFVNDFTLTFRAYNSGIAYRFSTSKKDPLKVIKEEANFNFQKDYECIVPYVNAAMAKSGKSDMYFCSFENTYTYAKLSNLNKDTLLLTPSLVNIDDKYKVVITEADLEDYPGMFLKATTQGLKGDFAPYPKAQKQGGHNNLQSLVLSREAYIAKTKGARNFPWRIVAISGQDKELLDNDLVYLLASPSRINDPSWIKPGKVAWDWWNDWNIKNVDFVAGINTNTYKYYIDFASQHQIAYILLDEGWANSLDIMDIVPQINLQEIIDYGKKKNVGIWLWGGWLPLSKKMDEALSKYAAMGIKGFKVDFMDRDDQEMVNFYYTLAEKAAAYKLLIDYHGAYKPTGLQRTYPNVLNFEGVYGMEQLKWANPDMPKNDLTIPYIRMLAGPLDYTPGAMSNANKNNFRAIHSKPMSQGTRCHQLAMYVIYEAPFSMLSDNPNAYQNEKESTAFIAGLPTVFDQTIALDGKVGAYAVIARRKGDTWYIGGMTDWRPRDIQIDLSFLPKRSHQLQLFKDGINAHRDGTDYITESKTIAPQDKLELHMAPGGGFAAIIK